MSYLHRIINVRSSTLALVIVMITACGSGTQAVANETWTLAELITKGERTDIVTEVVAVQNCGVVERKTTDCSAGTSNDLSVTLGGGVEGGEGLKVSVNTSVNAGLGIGRSSGESLNLDSPPDGFVYRYTVSKEYRVITGKGLVHSSTGNKQEATYAYHASCSNRIVSVDKLTCAEAGTLASTQRPKSTTLPPTPPSLAFTPMPTAMPVPPTATPVPPTPTKASCSLRPKVDLKPGIGGDGWKPDAGQDGNYTLTWIRNESNVNLVNTTITDGRNKKFSLGIIGAGTEVKPNLSLWLSSSANFEIRFDELGAGANGAPLYLCFSR